MECKWIRLEFFSLRFEIMKKMNVRILLLIIYQHRSIQMQLMMMMRMILMMKMMKMMEVQVTMKQPVMKNPMMYIQ